MKNKAFTLIEIIVAMVIVAVLVSLTLPLFVHTKKQKVQGIVVIMKHIKDNIAICQMMGTECDQFHHVVTWFDSEGKSHKEDRGLEMDDPSNIDIKYGYQNNTVMAVSSQGKIVMENNDIEGFGIYKGVL